MEDIRDIIEEKAVEKLKKSAFAKEHPGCLVVDAECQLPEEAQEAALCIVRKPESYIGRDAILSGMVLHGNLSAAVLYRRQQFIKVRSLE